MAQTRTHVERLADITSRKHQGNTESRIAHGKVSHVKHAQRMAVLELIKQEPHTMKEVAELLGVPLHACSGRGSELKAFGLVEPTSEMRDGSRELRATVRAYQPMVIISVPESDRESVEPLSPAQYDRELAKLTTLYEKSAIQTAEYDRAHERLTRGFEQWMNQ